MSKKSNRKSVTWKPEIELAIVNDSDEKNPENYTVHTFVDMSPELQLVFHNYVRNYAYTMLEQEKKKHKKDRMLTMAERGLVANTVAYCNMVIRTQAPIIYRDLNLQEAQNAEKDMENKIKNIKIAGKFDSL